MTLFQWKHVEDTEVQDLQQWYQNIVTKPASLKSFGHWPQTFDIEMKNIQGVSDVDSCMVKFWHADQQRVMYTEVGGKNTFTFKFSELSTINDHNKKEFNDISR